MADAPFMRRGGEGTPGGGSASPASGETGGAEQLQDEECSSLEAEHSDIRSFKH